MRINLIIIALILSAFGVASALDNASAADECLFTVVIK